MTDTVPISAYEDTAPPPVNGARTLARDHDLERYVLHLALVVGLTGELIDAGLQAEHFDWPRHQTVWRAASEAFAAGDVVDVHTIRPWLAGDVHDRDLADIAAETVPATTRGPQWVAELQRLAHERRFDLVLSEVTQARADGVPVETARAKLASLTEELAGAGWTATSWEPIPLLAALEGEEVPPPSVLAHRRGHRLLYAARTHTFQGPSESLKSWMAQAATREVLAEGGHVLYVDFEDDERGVVTRLRALGVPDEQMLTQLVYVRPDEPLMDSRDRYTRAGLRFAELIGERTWALAVVDGVTEAMTTEGLELNDNADAARFARRILRPLAETGAAVVAIDHQTKSGEGGRFAIGAQHKLAGLTGAAFRFEPERPLGRAAGSEPVVGLVKVTVSKDRPGHVRSKAPDGLVGKLQVTAWPDGKVDAEIVDPADLGDVGADLALVARILDHLATYDGSSSNQLEKAIQGKAAGIRAAVTWMVGKKWIRVVKEGQAHRHYLTDDGRREVSA